VRAANGIFDWIILSLAVAGLATVVGFDRERAFYPDRNDRDRLLLGIVHCDGSF
jgi:hypothetical protein